MDFHKMSRQADERLNETVGQLLAVVQQMDYNA